MKRRRLKLTCIVACWTTVALALALSFVEQSRSEAKFSQLISERVILSYAKLPKPVEALRSQVAEIMRSNRSVWEKATTIRNLERAAAPIGSGDCADYSRWYLALVRPYGLQARMVVGSLNALNLYDTHTSVEVWLPRRRRWVLVGPTFGGEYTVRGRPVGAFDLQRLILAGRTNEVHWKSTHTKNATMPSDYYVDSVLLFRYVAVWGEVGGKIAMVANADSRALGQLAATKLDDNTAPNTPILVESSQGKLPEPAPGNPPWYATHRVHSSYRGAVVLVAPRRFVYRGYASAKAHGLWFSPIVLNRGGLPTGVTAFGVRRFPATRES